MNSVSQRPVRRFPWMAALLALACSMNSFAAEEGFTPLFNGENLSGWSGNPKLWRVEDGLIVGSTKDVEIKSNTFLFADKTYSDFILKVSVKLENGNSGIQFRSEKLPDYAAAGYQADVAEKTYFGMLYEEKKRGILPYWNALTEEQRAEIFATAKQGDWNEYVITAQGDHLTMLLNGKTVLDLVDPEGAKDGYIALQLHVGPGMNVFFKDILIKEHPAPAAAPAPAPAPVPAPEAAPVAETPAPQAAVAAEPLMEDFEARKEKMSFKGERFRVPDGFQVVEVASNELLGSPINMTFDYKGRPIVAVEGGPLVVLLDENGDGIYDGKKPLSDKISQVMGVHYIDDHRILVQSEGPEGPGVYLLTDNDLDDNVDEVKSIVDANSGGMGEHAPHAIEIGPDGYYYIMYGNHSSPAMKLEPDSPSRGLQEDHLLPRYVDPRGHATHILAPGGTLNRLSPDFKSLEQFTGGYRNAYDFDINAAGEAFTFDSDMEWDVGLPWYRPVRVVHAVPGGDYGWRTGSTKMPNYYFDTLPALDDVGRGSPVGTRFYEHHVYPENYNGAFFMGDWSRGRIRVVFPKESGATYAGKSVDFLVGEPLNVTDLDVGPDGLLYFTIGGRGTYGGMFKVTYTGGAVKTPASDLDAILTQPMPRSAWGKASLRALKAKLGDGWEGALTGAAGNPTLPSAQRLRALEALQVYGPQPSLDMLINLAADGDEYLRAQAVYLLGLHPFTEVCETLTDSLLDTAPTVARRAAESLLRAGLNESTRAAADSPLLQNLLANLNHNDRFVRYAARNTLERVYRDIWADAVLADNIAVRPHGTLEGLLALVHTQKAAAHSDAIFAKLDEIGAASLAPELLLDYLRLLQLAFIRDVTGGDGYAALAKKAGQRLLPHFPNADWRLNRELQLMLAYTQTPEAINPMLALLTQGKTQEEEIHTVYALRALKEGWNKEQRDRLAAWFDRGRDLGGGASMEGYINNLWESALESYPEEEKTAALARKAEALAKRQEEALKLIAELEGQRQEVNSDLAQMSFQELAEYLEYDPMAYRPGGTREGRNVFIRAKCANCHVFGTVGKGGGPDLSTVTARFRRRDILESIMYPSKTVSDQYVGVEVETKDFSIYTGMAVGENDESLSLIDVNGQRMDIMKSEIVTRKNIEGSTMPEGLLNTMNLGELVNLIKFLEAGADAK
ncbi:MAG: DUF1080 domain-containing protein [Candidatus Hydrogenedentes bacterium]|nr:DUF1080 domain-containing protein [Candidatus Hydrogenedentota bacterium]